MKPHALCSSGNALL